MATRQPQPASHHPPVSTRPSAQVHHHPGDVALTILPESRSASTASGFVAGLRQLTHQLTHQLPRELAHQLAHQLARGANESVRKAEAQYRLMTPLTIPWIWQNFTRIGSNCGFAG